MRVVLVVDPGADPAAEAGSFVRRIADRAAGALSAGGTHVDLVDLLAERFSPVMTVEDRRAYFSPQPLVCAETTASAQLVRGATGLVLVYPTTLSTVPPRLKGWIERVLVPGVAFTIGERTGAKPGLSNIRRITGITVHRDARLDVLRHGDNGRRLIRRNLRLCGGLGTTSTWIALYDEARATQDDRDAFLAVVERRMARR